MMNPMDTRILAFYRELFADLTVDREEAAELTDFLESLNPPPDKLTWLRANAFKVGCEFLTEDDKEANVSLLRTINYVVHAIEKTCLVPKPVENTVDLDEDTVTAFYQSVYDGLTVDTEECAEVTEFFSESNPPAVGDLVQMRALAFKVACDHLADDKETNVKLLRCVNVIVHVFEHTCLEPKPYHFKAAQVAQVVASSPSPDLSSMDLPEAIQHLWNLDANRLTPGVDYDIQVGRGKKPYWKEDSAPDPLFTSVQLGVWRRPTYKAFVSLLDNYVAETGVAESVTDAERAETRNFLRAIMQTAPMQFCHQYCHAKDPNRVSSSLAGFSKVLQEIWFDLYHRQRGGRPDSSGFEHVFVGEVKNGDVSGFHNWIQFYLEEKKGGLDYRGCIKPRGRSEADADGDDHLLSLQFNWKGVEKFVGTSFVGVSPEFEMALYTMCFLIGEEENEVSLNTGTDVFGVKIKCYRMGRDKIGTSYPEVTSHYED